jgi:16S rRNA (cytosine1402-N4)-methyltransferase
MALRLAVNNELGELEALLQAAPNLVAGGGRIVIITFMSLEDRKVKQGFQDLQRANKISVLTKHVVKPKDQEVNENAPSRSAKLRAAEVQAQ